MRITQIAGTGNIERAFHQQFEAVQEIIDIAKRAGLRAIAVKCDRLVPKRLDDEVGYDPAVILQHPRPVGIENASDFDRYPMKSMIIKEQCFRGTLAFIITGTRAGY